METVPVSELSGPALDWAVARCEQPHDNRLTVIRREDYIGQPVRRETEPGSYMYEWWAPSRIWAQAGPIIEREKIDLFTEKGTPESWCASVARYQNGKRLVGWRIHAYGPTPLIAAMRCYVASKLDDTVEIPDELL